MFDAQTFITIKHEAECINIVLYPLMETLDSRVQGSRQVGLRPLIHVTEELEHVGQVPGSRVPQASHLVRCDLNKYPSLVNLVLCFSIKTTRSVTNHRDTTHRNYQSGQTIKSGRLASSSGDWRVDNF